MKVEIVNKKVNQIKADCEVVLVPGKQLKHKWIKDQKLFKEQRFQGKPDQVLFLPHKKKIYVGLETLRADDIRVAIALAVTTIKKTTYKSLKVGLYFREEPTRGARALAEGAHLGAYQYDNYKSKKEKATLARLIISTETYAPKITTDLKELKQAVSDAHIVAHATNFTRDIVNQSPADLTPVRFAELAREVAKDKGLKVTVQGEKYLEKVGMGAFLAVSRASSYPPQLIHLSRTPKDPKAKVVLVGKGLTYDTGGLSLKPSNAMATMKIDMGGAGAILGAIQAISQLDIPVEVHAVIGATENAIGKDAYKPDEILVAKNGKTIEVKNTDAEGRLVLADCLVYAQELKPDYIVDVATLTGACMIAVGNYTSAVMGYDKDLKQALLAAAENSGELLAELPFNRYLPKLIQSKIADISNLPSSSYGAAITAGLFLGEFIEKPYKKKWAHIDIAGSSYAESPWGYNPDGGTGAGVRLLVEWVRGLAS